MKNRIIRDYRKTQHVNKQLQVYFSSNVFPRSETNDNIAGTRTSYYCFYKNNRQRLLILESYPAHFRQQKKIALTAG